MMYEPQTLIANLMATMDQINEQIQEVNVFAAQQEVPVSTVMYQDGRWVMAELSLAKAQVLHAMVLMEEQLSREVTRKQNKEAYEKEVEQAMSMFQERTVYVYNGRSVQKVGQYQQSDHVWLQTAAERNKNHIYFYAKDV